MIDGSDIGPKRQRKKRVRRSFVQLSLPEEREAVEESNPYEEFFPGQGMSSPSRPRGERVYIKLEECVSKSYNLAEMALEGYYKCKSPCNHVQPREEGGVCMKCNGTMKLVEDLKGI